VLTRSRSERQEGDTLSASIIIDSYNYENFLRQCIDSALAQTHKAEVVVVDDGSTDDSPEVVDSYGPSILSIFFPVNRGQAAALNAGISKATGDVVLFLDSDDWIPSNRVERVLQEFEADRDLQVVRHDMFVVDEQGALRSPRMYGFRAQSDPAEELLRFGLLPGSGGCLVFRRYFLEQLGPIPEECYRRGPDAYMGLAGAISGGLRTIEEPLYFRRSHASQATRRWHEDPSSATFMTYRRWCTAMDAAQLAQRFQGAKAMATGHTWWQKKAVFEYQKGRRQAPWVATWIRHLRLLLDAEMPAMRKSAELVRSVTLGVLPGRFFLRAWWKMHQGRPRNRLIDALGTRQMTARASRVR
jgi:glycosyltransferase involved in cell wall biosynthesis